jgi:hypothetical protein
MSFTMDNGLFAALFRLDCIIAEQPEKMMLQRNIYLEGWFLTVAELFRASMRGRHHHCKCLFHRSLFAGPGQNTVPSTPKLDLLC